MEFRFGNAVALFKQMAEAPDLVPQLARYVLQPREPKRHVGTADYFVTEHPLVTSWCLQLADPAAASNAAQLQSRLLKAAMKVVELASTPTGSVRMMPSKRGLTSSCPVCATSAALAQVGEHGPWGHGVQVRSHGAAHGAVHIRQAYPLRAAAGLGVEAPRAGGAVVVGQRGGAAPPVVRAPSTVLAEVLHMLVRVGCVANAATAPRVCPCGVWSSSRDGVRVRERASRRRRFLGQVLG